MAATSSSWFNVSKLEGKTVFNLRESLGDSSYGIFCRAGVHVPHGKYIVTEKFRNFLEVLERKKCDVTITGAKGVGKSCSLIMLAALSRKRWVFVTSRQCLSGQEEVAITEPPPLKRQTRSSGRLSGQEVAITEPPPLKRQKRSSGQSQSTAFQGSLKQLWSELSRTQEEILLLVDLSEWNGAQADDRIRLVSFLHDIAFFKQLMNVRVVIAHSSGMGECADVVLDKAVSKVQICTHKVSWTPFRREETELFLETFKAEFPGSMSTEILESHTLNNPGLMERCFGSDNVMEMTTSVYKAVRQIARALLIEFNELDIHQTIKSFRMASSGDTFEIAQLEELLCSKAFAHNLVYVVQTANSDTYTIKPSYPKFLSFMFDILKSSDKLVLAPTVQGCLFQMRFFDHLVSLDVCYVHDTGAKVTKDAYFICSSVSNNRPAVGKLIPNVCYHLGYSSPAIDALGVFKDVTSSKSWLVLIQVSLSPYSQHRSKAGDAFFAEQELSQYAAGQGMNTMYLYVSPKTGSPVDMNEPGLRSRTSDKYLATVKESTRTSEYVTKCSILSQTF